MSKLLRLSAFNCQNLFSRARLLELADSERSAGLIDQAERLAGLLARPGKGVDGRVEALARALARYAEVTPGGLKLRRNAVDAAQRDLKAKVIRAVNADVQCLAEVEDRPSLFAFNRGALRGAFAHEMLVGSLDPRAIDVGVMSKLPIRSMRSHRVEGAARHRTTLFGRDDLEVELALGDGRALHLFVCHFRSRGHGDARDGDGLRRLQAGAVAQTLATRFDLAQDLVAVLGDFGDSPQRAPQCLAPLLQLGGLHDALALQLPIPDDRWTVHRRRNEQVDYILVSDALKARLRGAGIERRGMPDLEQHSIAQERPFAEIGAGAPAASAHAAVWADFEL